MGRGVTSGVERQWRCSHASAAEAWKNGQRSQVRLRMPRSDGGGVEEKVKVPKTVAGSLVTALVLWAGAAWADGPLPLGLSELDRVTAGAGYAYFVGAGAAGFSGAGGSSTIEGWGNATYNEEAVFSPDGTLVKLKRDAKGTYSGRARARVQGGVASASLTAGSGVVLN